MWKLSFLALAVSFSLHADKAAVVNEMGGDDPDDHKYAVTPGNPSEGDDPLTGEKNNPAACVSTDDATAFERRSTRTVSKIVELSGNSKNVIAIHNVQAALKHGKMIDQRSGNLGEKVDGAGAKLVKYKFINILECKEWRDKIHNGTGLVPQGAVMTYGSGGTRQGDIRIRTHMGCIGKQKSDTRCLVTGQKLTGVYIKVGN